VFYQLHKYNVIRVYRDKTFIEAKYGELKPVWEKITEMRKDKAMYDVYMAPPASQQNKIPKEQITIDTIYKASYIKKGNEVKFSGYAFID
jgi:hypothetical protein